MKKTQRAIEPVIQAVREFFTTRYEGSNGLPWTAPLSVPVIASHVHYTPHLVAKVLPLLLAEKVIEQVGPEKSITADGLLYAQGVRPGAVYYVTPRRLAELREALATRRRMALFGQAERKVLDAHANEVQAAYKALLSEHDLD